MRRAAWQCLGTVAVAAIVAGGLSALHATGRGRESTPEAAWDQREVVRIQRHLEGAERLILSAGTEHLSKERRAARARNVAILRDYRVRGRFPRNEDFPGQRVPYFVDDRGVLCAMAHLIAASGRRDIVDRIQATRNNARILELAADRELVAWLEESGLTLAEAARIQPTYGHDPEPDRISPAYAMASVAATFADGATMAWMLSGNRPPATLRAPALLGLLASTVSVGLGTAKLERRDDAHKLGIWNLAVGALSLGISAHALQRSEAARATLTSERLSPRGATFAVAPMLGPAPGVRLALSF